MRTGGGGAGDSRQDVLFNRFYRQVTRRHAARLGPGYDIAADGHRLSGRPGGAPLRPGEILEGPGESTSMHSRDCGPTAMRTAPLRRCTASTTPLSSGSRRCWSMTS